MKQADKTSVFKALPSQWEFLHAIEPEVLLSGSAGSGKTRALCLKAVMQACIPGNVAILARKWLVNLKSTTLRTLLEWEGDKPPVLPLGTYRHNRSEKRIHIYGGGDILYIGVGDDITRIRSLAAGIICVDEMVELQEEEWLELKLRARISVGCGQIVGATNPGDTSHWGYNRFINPNHNNPDTRVIYSLAKDNYHLPLHAQKALLQLKGTIGERMRDGLWVGVDRLIYGAYPPGIFVGTMPDMSLMQQWYISIDYGWTNPTFILFAGIDCDGRLWIYEEYEKSHLLIENILNWLEKKKDFQPVVVVDPSAAGLIAEIQSKGFTCIKANNDVKIGIDKCRDVMAAGMVRAYASCVNLRRSLTNYVRKPDGVPEKNDDHGCFVAGTLVETENGAVPIEQIKKGDKVLTRAGYCRVVDAGITGYNKSVTTFDFGYGPITCTPTHRFITDDGKKESLTLTLLDTIFVFNKQGDSPCKLKSLHTKASRFDAIPNQSDDPNHCTTRHTLDIFDAVFPHCIAKYGKTPLGLFQKGATFIILMVTRLTTNLRIFNWLLQKSMVRFMQSYIDRIQRMYNDSRRIFPRYAPLLPHGTNLLQDVNGVERMPYKLDLENEVSHSMAYASTAELHSRAMRHTVESDFVQVIAKPIIEKHVELTTSPVNVQDVKRNTRSISTLNRRIARVPVRHAIGASSIKATVYNLTVEREHEFFANGYLVANCDALRYLTMAAVGQRIESLLEEMANPPSNYFFGRDETKGAVKKRDPFDVVLPTDQDVLPFMKAI